MARNPRLLFHAKNLLIRAIHGNDALPRYARKPCAPRAWGSGALPTSRSATPQRRVPDGANGMKQALAPTGKSGRPASAIARLDNWLADAS
jgi:hypothetical protein